jgi:hypothetical protein
MNLVPCDQLQTAANKCASAMVLFSENSPHFRQRNWLGPSKKLHTKQADYRLSLLKQLPCAYLSPFTTLSAMRSSSTLFRLGDLSLATSYRYPLMIYAFFLSLIIYKWIRALVQAT